MNTSLATFSLKHTQQIFKDTVIKIFVYCAEIIGRGFGGFGGTEHRIWTPPASYVLLDYIYCAKVKEETCFESNQL